MHHGSWLLDWCMDRNKPTRAVKETSAVSHRAANNSVWQLATQRPCCADQWAINVPDSDQHEKRRGLATMTTMTAAIGVPDGD